MEEPKIGILQWKFVCNFNFKICVTLGSKRVGNENLITVFIKTVYLVGIRDSVR
jgi:hypothetical protein